jgi:outer membrane lipoprotein-sorting protein
VADDLWRPKLIKRIVIVLFFALVGFVAPVQALDRPLTPEEEQLIREIGEYNSSIKSMAGRFLQIDSLGERTEGTFFIARPGKVRFRYAPPSREEIRSFGRGFYVIDRQEKTQYAYPSDRVPLRQFLAENIDLFSANIVDVVSSDDFISVTIADETPIGLVQVALIFEIETKDLKQWTLTEPNGAELTFSLYDVIKNVEIPSAYFLVDPSYRAVTRNSN